MADEIQNKPMPVTPTTEVNQYGDKAIHADHIENLSVEVNVYGDQGSSPTDENGVPFVPLTPTRYDSESRIIYLGNETVKLPVQLTPQSNIADHELPYINALCEVYAEKISQAVTPDTIDKLDENYMLRDAKLNAKATCLILNARHIPVNIPNFLLETQRFLVEIEKNLAKDFDVTSVKSAFSQLEKLVPSFQDAYLASEDSDEILKKVAGELTRVIYTCCDPYHQDPALSSTPLQGLAKACGITRDNTSAEKFLFITTEFYRQRNRLVGEINRITETINNYIRA